MVCQDLGLDSGAYSFGYLASWAGSGEAAVAGVKASCLRVQRAASFIISALDGRPAGPCHGSVVVSGVDRVA